MASGPAESDSTAIKASGSILRQTTDNLSHLQRELPRTVDQDDLLDLLANDQRHEDDWQRFVTACQGDAEAHGGKVSVNRVRGLLSNDWGLEVEPRRYSALWNRAIKSGVLVNTEEWETCTDTAGRNAGKPQRVRRWSGPVATGGAA